MDAKCEAEFAEKSDSPRVTLTRPGLTQANRVESSSMNEYRVTIIGAGFESSSGWTYTADAPPAPGDEIEITSARPSSLGGGVSREFVRVEAIHADGTISAEEII